MSVSRSYQRWGYETDHPSDKAACLPARKGILFHKVKKNPSCSTRPIINSHIYIYIYISTENRKYEN